MRANSEIGCWRGEQGQRRGERVQVVRPEDGGWVDCCGEPGLPLTPACTLRPSRAPWPPPLPRSTAAGGATPSSTHSRPSVVPVTPTAANFPS